MPSLPPFPFATFRVSETSMQPALRPGENVFVLRWFRPRVGDIVVVRDPESPRQFLLKRLSRRTADGTWEVRADNANVGRDSRHFGPVASSLLVGRVVWRYAKR
jgi:nickel-type superoxide dismutase maturation protease